MPLTTTCFGPQVAIIRLYTLKWLLSTTWQYKYLDVEISYTLQYLYIINDNIMLDIYTWTGCLQLSDKYCQGGSPWWAFIPPWVLVLERGESCSLCGK